MRLTEKNLWTSFKGYLPGNVDRVENGVCPGFPDASGTWDGHDYWVELKVRQLLPQDISPLMRDTQLLWARRRLREGVQLFILVRHRQGFLLAHARSCDGVRLAYDPYLYGKKKEELELLTHKIQELLCRKST